VCAQHRSTQYVQTSTLLLSLNAYRYQFYLHVTYARFTPPIVPGWVHEHGWCIQSLSPNSNINIYNLCPFSTLSQKCQLMHYQCNCVPHWRKKCRSHQVIGQTVVYQDIFTADMRPFVTNNVLFTSFSCFFSLCSTSLRSRSSRRFSRNADSTSIDKSSSFAQPPLTVSSSVPNSLLCHTSIITTH